MTPKMVRALSEAELSFNCRGLERTAAGWIASHPRRGVLDYHSFTTVNALVDRGYLQLFDRGKAAHITEAGQIALDRWREERGA